MTLDEGAKRRLIEQAQLEALRGRRPRSRNPRLGADALDERYLASCRQLLSTARPVSDQICTKLERECPELSPLDDAGLAGRIRYLTTIACVATAVDLRLRTDSTLERLPYLKTVHQTVEDWRRGATHDLSNLLGPLEFLPVVGRSRDDVLGFWIWLNLEDGGTHPRVTWVKSSMRFAAAYGEEILRHFGPDADMGSGDSSAQAPSGETGVSRAEARLIVEDHLAEHPVPRATGRVREVLGWDEIDARRPGVYGHSESFWESQWIAYLEREQEGLAIRESLILVVNRETGEIGYVGGANDEG